MRFGVLLRCEACCLVGCAYPGMTLWCRVSANGEELRGYLVWLVPLSLHSVVQGPLPFANHITGLWKCSNMVTW